MIDFVPSTKYLAHNENPIPTERNPAEDANPLLTTTDCLLSDIIKHQELSLAVVHVGLCIFYVRIQETASGTNLHTTGAAGYRVAVVVGRPQQPSR